MNTIDESQSSETLGWPAELTEQWQPAQHPHIQLRYETRKIDPMTGLPDPQAFEVRCLHVSDRGVVCALQPFGRWRGSCSSGRIREKALVFAARHLHRDPLAVR